MLYTVLHMETIISFKISVRGAKSDRGTLFQTADSHLSEQTDVAWPPHPTFHTFSGFAKIPPRVLSFIGFAQQLWVFPVTPQDS